MPKPQHIYIKARSKDAINLFAEQSKSIVATSNAANIQAFYDAISQLPEREIDEMQRLMASYVDALRKDEPFSKDDKTRKEVSEVYKATREWLEKVQDYRQLEGRLQLPVYPVMRAPADVGTAGLTLALAIAVCQILEAAVRMRKIRR
ncbi:hypothetical protein [Paraburkholderia sp. J63]|uniref:hypothetical protein n=1 Tax=Paraburkholderia sp. J63 TaxID=2805434 RepID=UPI002ABD4B0A|nr:hypothetical protein [Paraburkholderia sp. J63]